MLPVYAVRRQSLGQLTYAGRSGLHHWQGVVKGGIYRFCVTELC